MQNIDIPISVGFDSESSEYAVGSNQNTDMHNIDIRIAGTEKKREGCKLNIDNEYFSDREVANLYFWVRDNLVNNRAWLMYDKKTGSLIIKEG